MSSEGQGTADNGRRQFLIGIGVVAGGTAAGMALRPWLVGAAEANRPPADFQPHAFVRISSDDTITVIIGKSEMGQGVYGSLPMILAEELDVDPTRVQVEIAGVDPAFNHPFLPAQFTGGSMSVMTTYDALRRVGAQARSAMLTAAARQWNVDVITLTTDNGVVRDSRGRRLRYGSLVEAANRLPLPDPTSVILKDPSTFKYIGKPQRRLDSPIKVTGKATFGIDVMRPDMLTAVIARPPAFGARLRGFDATAAKAISGVIEVKAVPSGVAVIAQHTHAALRGREALILDWDTSASDSLSSDGLRDEWRALAKRPGLVGKNVGDVDAAFRSAARTIDVEYELPYLAHACMEPLNAVAEVTAEGCELWLGTQSQSQDARFVAEALGIEPSKVRIHTMFLGGGFGRRASAVSDFAVEAALVAQGIGKPVKVVWTREDDMRGGYYRPLSFNRVKAAINADGMPLAIHHTTVSKPVLANTAMGKMAVSKEGLDPSTIEGSADMPYAIPNLRVDVHNTREAVPILWWRSVGHSITGFVTNSVIDELAVLGGKDAYEYRRELLKEKPRHLAVLERAAAEANWGRGLAKGHFQGIALQESFGSIVAQVAEVSVSEGKVQVHRVTCAVDCGLAVNPSQVVAQMESGILYGLSAALDGEINIERGRAVEGNFDRYRVLRFVDSPVIDVHIVNSGGPIGGIGEPGTPPIAPAVCNAIFAATGQRIRRLPISKSLSV
ncbi:MAG: molybdopterin cofactor-binding domain-containing protein [Steroidobacteraceae bacterium]